MKIILRKTSLVDYPGKVSSVFFFSGCNLRCPWCHNRELVLGGAADLVDVEDGLAHVVKRRTVLGGVVLSGGEPCLCEDLPDIIREIKKIKPPDGNAAISVKLDTNGMFPAVLEKLFSSEDTRPDYIALDLKIAPSRYGELIDPERKINHGETRSFDERFSFSSVKPCGLRGKKPGDNLFQSAALIRDSGIAHEFRTLALPASFITEKDIEALAPLAGSAPWYFRPFRAGNCLDPAWDSLEEPAADCEKRTKALAEKARELGKTGIAPAS